MGKSIMVQGTMSNAGKSLLVAGLCRIFKQDGYSVAPFKSQNMALNSFITADGMEMGRAQVMQAEAAGIEPEVGMNPILLKPNTDNGSQVIVCGEVQGNMDAKAYYAYKNKLRTMVMDAYSELASRFDIVVIEGAGSPAEINLRDQDLVNMGMAEMANSPVLLAGDIDPGGVFAQLYGTIKLLTPAEQDRIKGMIINKFRGDVDILKPGLPNLERLCEKPVLGVVPFMRLDIDDEDSLSVRLRNPRSTDAILDVAVVRLRHLSNFTDFNALDRHPKINVRYVEKAEDLGRPDLLILPGSKNTMADMRGLNETGMTACIQALGRDGTPIIGICGGYQLLGEKLSDPDGIEAGGIMAGLGLLPMETLFTPAKTRTRTEATLDVDSGFFASLGGTALNGYEIHMGKTTGTCAHAVTLNYAEGAVTDGGVRGNVLGTYLHGFFDAPGLVEKLADLLLTARGLPTGGATMLDHEAHKETQYDKLAQGLRDALDMDKIYEIVEKGLK